MKNYALSEEFQNGHSLNWGSGNAIKIAAQITRVLNTIDEGVFERGVSRRLVIEVTEEVVVASEESEGTSEPDRVADISRRRNRSNVESGRRRE
jgi:hypothetical protein